MSPPHPAIWGMCLHPREPHRDDMLVKRHCSNSYGYGCLLTPTLKKNVKLKFSLPSSWGSLNQTFFQLPCKENLAWPAVLSLTLHRKVQRSHFRARTQSRLLNFPFFFLLLFKYSCLHFPLSTLPTPNFLNKWVATSTWFPKRWALSVLHSWYKPNAIESPWCVRHWLQVKNPMDWEQI